MVTLDGEPWFVAGDVAKALKLTRHGKMFDHLSSDEKQLCDRTSHKLGSGRAAWLITESGLYKLIMRSDKPEARAFQDWVTRVVLPAIRKDGAYVMSEEKVVSGEMSEDELILKAVDILSPSVTRSIQRSRSCVERHRPVKQSQEL